MVRIMLQFQTQTTVFEHNDFSTTYYFKRILWTFEFFSVLLTLRWGFNAYLIKTLIFIGACNFLNCFCHFYSCKLSVAILRCSWFFLFRRLTLFFRFTFVHTAKLKKSNFLNDFFLSLTAFARVTSFLTRFCESFQVICVMRFWSYVTYLTQ